MDFSNLKKEGVVLYQFFLPSPLQCAVTHYRNCTGLREFEEVEISCKAVEVTLNSKEKNCYDFCLDFVQEFGLTSAGGEEWGSMLCAI
jgi:hypothetical protein